MPIRIGFTQQREVLLEEDLQRIIQALPQLGVLRVIRTDTEDPDSTLRLIFVMSVDWPFVRRPDFFYSHLMPQVGADFIVYTPEEFDQIAASNTRLGDTIRKGQVLA